MPFIPRDWVVWTCYTCKSIVNVTPSPEVANRTPRCPFCQMTPRTAPETRAALEIPGMGIIGGGETAGLDYLAAIANALLDLRNKYFAVNHVPEPMDVSQAPEGKKCDRSGSRCGQPFGHSGECV